MSQPYNDFLAVKSSFESGAGRKIQPLTGIHPIDIQIVQNCLGFTHFWVNHEKNFVEGWFYNKFIAGLRYQRAGNFFTLRL
jgi:hypothetical protein